MGKKTKKGKLKSTEETSADVQATTETVKKKKKATTGSEEIAKKVGGTEPPKLEKKEPVKDTSQALPNAIKARKIVCKEIGPKIMTSKVEVEDIKATSKYLYVDDIHSANPKVLQTIYWLIMPNTRHVCARVEESEYEYLRQNYPKMSHHIAVVDCSVVPTLTYGSWQAQHLKKDFPSAEQIAAEDAEFKKNPTNFHNPPVRIEIVEAQDQLKAAEEVAVTEEEPEIDFDWADEDEDDDEEEEFDFSEDED